MIPTDGTPTIATGGAAIEAALASDHSQSRGVAVITARLEEIRAAIRSESISYGELAELQGLAEYIAPGDVELLEWAGVPEFPEEPPTHQLEVTEAVYDFAAWRVLVNLRTQWTEDALTGKLTDLSDVFDRLIVLERIYAENVRKHG